MSHVTVIALLVAGLIHLLPVPGVAGAGVLARLYGIEVSGTDTAILLQHRALLFGLLGLLMLSAIPWPALRLPALAIGLASAASFVAVALWVGGYNEAIRRVVIADVVAAVLLAAGLATELMARGGRTG